MRFDATCSPPPISLIDTKGNLFLELKSEFTLSLRLGTAVRASRGHGAGISRLSVAHDVGSDHHHLRAFCNVSLSQPCSRFYRCADVNIKGEPSYSRFVSHYQWLQKFYKTILKVNSDDYKSFAVKRTPIMWNSSTSSRLNWSVKITF